MARAPSEEPAGLVLRPELLSADEESALLELLAGLRFDPIVMHGQAARRTARWSWQHSMPPTKALRHSITFRTLKEPAA
jgi:hypothetical protein